MKKRHNITLFSLQLGWELFIASGRKVRDRNAAGHKQHSCISYFSCCIHNGSIEVNIHTCLGIFPFPYCLESHNSV